MKHHDGDAVVLELRRQQDHGAVQTRLADAIPVVVGHRRAVGHEGRHGHRARGRADRDDFLLFAGLDVADESFDDLQRAGHVGVDEIIQQLVVERAEFLILVAVGLVHRLGAHQAGVAQQDVDGHALELRAEGLDLAGIGYVHALDPYLRIPG